MAGSSRSSCSHKSKKRKRNQKQKYEEKEDRISSLPDCLLLYIMSFLSTLAVVRTSVLSKRWRNLWTSISTIELHDSPLNWPPEKHEYYPIRKQCFFNFMDNLLSCTKHLTNFYLFLTIPFEQFHVNAWICAAMKCGVQDFELNLSNTSSTYIFPCFLFNFETLTILKLNNCFLHIHMPSCFPNLRKCRLSYVTFLDGESTQFHFPYSPSLLDLVLKDCTWKKSTTFIIDIPSLKRFKMTFDDLHHCIKLYAPNLKVFILWGGFLWDQFLLCNTCSLSQASINFSTWETSEEIKVKQAVNIFNSIQSVDSLKIHDFVLRNFRSVENLNLVDLLSTWNLTHLRVDFDDCFDYGIDLMGILSGSCNLESLFIDACLDSSSNFWPNDEWMEYCAPSSFKIPLKQVMIEGFTGNVAEMHMLEILMKHGASLEIINLIFLPVVAEDLEKLEEIKNILLKFPKASPSCVIKLN